MRILQKFKKFLNREIIFYLIFGVLTTAVAFITYAVFLFIGMGIFSANTLSTFIAIVFAYVTNKIWVFEALDFNIKKILKEFAVFLSSRFFSYVVDTVLLIILVDFFLQDPLISKLGTSVIVIILNYVSSKLIVFRKKA